MYTLGIGSRQGLKLPECRERSPGISRSPGVRQTCRKDYVALETSEVRARDLQLKGACILGLCIQDDRPRLLGPWRPWRWPPSAPPTKAFSPLWALQTVRHLPRDEEAAGRRVAVDVLGAEAMDRVCREPRAWFLGLATFPPGARPIQTKSLLKLPQPRRLQSGTAGELPSPRQDLHFCWHQTADFCGCCKAASCSLELAKRGTKKRSKRTCTTCGECAKSQLWTRYRSRMQKSIARYRVKHNSSYASEDQVLRFHALSVSLESLLALC